MLNDYWEKQTQDKPLYQDLIWSRPENKLHAGKLLIIGGNIQSFQSVAQAYSEASKAGAGVVRAIMPDSLERTVSKVFKAGDYTDSTPSGSFSRKALPTFLDQSDWADMVLVAGDLGRNSETAILLEEYSKSYIGHLCITKDAADYFTSMPAILNRENTLLVISFSQLQKLAISAKFTSAFTFDIGLIKLIELLHEFTSTYKVIILVKHLENMLISQKGRVISHRLSQDLPSWRLKVASQASVWWMQNNSKALEAVASSLISSTSQNG